MKRLLAISVGGDWVGDWHCVRGDEQGVIVHPIAAGESVLLEVELKDEPLALVEVELSAGLNRINIEGWRRFRLVKRCGGAAALSHTTVELDTHV